MSSISSTTQSLSYSAFSYTQVTSDRRHRSPSAHHTPQPLRLLRHLSQHAQRPQPSLSILAPLQTASTVKASTQHCGSAIATQPRCHSQPISWIPQDAPKPSLHAVGQSTSSQYAMRVQPCSKWPWDPPHLFICLTTDGARAGLRKAAR